MSNILYLPIKAQWFDMICSGIKQEEYRDLSHHWKSRIRNPFKKPQIVELRNGYSKNARKARFEIRYIEIKHGNPEWGAPTDKKVFAIGIGARVPA